MVSLLTENIILVSVRNIMAENETFFANSGVSLVPIMVLFIEKVMVRAGTKSNLYLQHLKTLSNFYLFYQCYRCPSLRCCLPWLWSKTISSKKLIDSWFVSRGLPCWTYFPESFVNHVHSSSVFRSEEGHYDFGDHRGWLLPFLVLGETYAVTAFTFWSFYFYDGTL